MDVVHNAAMNHTISSFKRKRQMHWISCATTSRVECPAMRRLKTHTASRAHGFPYDELVEPGVGVVQRKDRFEGKSPADMEQEVLKLEECAANATKYYQCIAAANAASTLV